MNPRGRAAAGHLKEGPLTGAVPRERGVVVVALRIARMMEIQVIIGHSQTSIFMNAICLVPFVFRFFFSVSIVVSRLSRHVTLALACLSRCSVPALVAGIDSVHV